MGTPNISSSIFDEFYSKHEGPCEFRSKFVSEVGRNLEVLDEGEKKQKEGCFETIAAAARMMCQ